MIYAKSGESHPNTSDEIFEQMLNRIIQLRLEPGQLISENQMSAEYGVSRSVIRTVFTRLKQLDFIEIYPQRGDLCQSYGFKSYRGSSDTAYSGGKGSPL